MTKKQKCNNKHKYNLIRKKQKLKNFNISKKHKIKYNNASNFVIKYIVNIIIILL